MICKEDYENTKSAIDVIAKAKGDRRDLAKFKALVCEAGFGFSGCSFQKHAQRILDILEYAEHKNDARLMPEGMRWPRFEDGEPVLVGDKFETMVSGIKKVDAIKFEDGYIFSLEFNNGLDTEFYKNAWVKRPEPKQETLQDVINDLEKNAVDYWGCELVSCENCTSLIDGKTPGEYYGNVTCDYAQRIEIKLRLEAIQERMGGEQ
jgi:hypothetical protein